MKPLTVPDRPLRLRPRDGAARCLVEQTAQWVWRWRRELMLSYLTACVTAAIVVHLLD